MSAAEISELLSRSEKSGSAVLRDVPDRTERRVLTRSGSVMTTPLARSQPSTSTSTSLGDVGAQPAANIVHRVAPALVPSAARTLRTARRDEPDDAFDATGSNAQQTGPEMGADEQGAAGRAQGYALGHQSGYREGYEEGRRQGMAQGLTEGREAGTQESLKRTEAAHQGIVDRLARLDQWCEALPAQVRAAVGDRLAQAQEDMAALCHDVICRLLGEHVVDAASVADAVRRAVEESIGTGAQRGVLQGLIAIHLHPIDLMFVREDATLAKWFADRGSAPIPWVADDRVELGGCLVQGAQGTLDARLDTQLAALRERLLGLRREGRSSMPADGGLERSPSVDR